MPVTVSAPGKLMLLGEHAVVYGRPCIVTAVGQRMHLTLDLRDDAVFALEAPDVSVSAYQKSLDQLGEGDVPKGARFLEHALRLFLKKFPSKRGVSVSTKSEFSSLFGFGSSSASTVCLIAGLSEAFGLGLSKKDVFSLAYETVLEVQKKGSGFDVAAAAFGGTLAYQSGGKRLEELHVAGVPLVIGYTGIKADTVQIVDEVKALADREPEMVEGVYSDIEYLVKKAEPAVRGGDWKTVGECMTHNHQLLQRLGVSSDKLDAMVSAAEGAGAYGAKLSGAGRGDCMIALADDARRPAIEAAIEAAGGQVIRVPANVPGVSITSV